MGSSHAEHILDEIVSGVASAELLEKDLKYIKEKLDEFIKKGKIEIPVLGD